MARADGGGGRSPRRPSPPTERIIVLLAAMVALAGSLYLGVLDDLPRQDFPFAFPWWGLALSFAAVETFVVHLHFRRDAHSFSLSEIPLVIGLFLVEPAGLIAARLLGSGLALVAYRRQRGIKLVFNLVSFTLEACVAVAVFRLLLPLPGQLGPRAWLAALSAGFVGNLLAALAVVGAISLSEGRLQRQMLPQVLPAVLVAASCNTSLALLTVTILRHDPRSSWLLAVVVVVLFVAYRAYSSLSQRYASLQVLYEITRATGRAQPTEALVEAVLDQARELLRAERASIVLFPVHDGGPTMQMEAGVEGGLEMSYAPVGGGGDVWAGAVREGRAVLVPRSTRDVALRRHLVSRGMKDCMVAPLSVESGVIGSITVANRLGEVTTFDAEDLKLFETLASHVSVSLENGRLIDRLRQQAAEREYEALHDSLTGLANRALFHREVEAAVRAAAPDGRSVAVMLMDLDRFKDVNDTLGHHNGDELLREVASRLLATLDKEITVARLGGDEFALLVPAIRNQRHAIEEATRVRLVLERPFVLEELTVEVGATIGIAVSPDHGTEASALLQRADVAMYAAKAADSGVEAYSSDRDQYTPRRLALAGELRQAIEQGDLGVHYQPKVDLVTGQTVGVEALVRWNHPVHGPVSPDEFIPVAEQTGVIRPLTTYVLEAALEQCRAWQAEGIRLGVAVNLSVRSLLDSELPAELNRLLRRTGVPPGMLTLEITESTMMADPARVIAVVNRLGTLGVKLSIDDFGTGYSSLSYLKRLPVQEVKVDKSFVMGMGSEESDATIVRSIIDLGANLGLRVVAEGVEDEPTWFRLCELGCNVAQGYFLSAPVPAAQLTRWLRKREPSRFLGPLFGVGDLQSVS
jgi:diguanylate cyclase (GGDEF)-like protein